MTEVEFEHLLEMIGTEMGHAPAQGYFDGVIDISELFENPPRATNDNSQAWPLQPFPHGWSASC